MPYLTSSLITQIWQETQSKDWYYLRKSLERWKEQPPLNPEVLQTLIEETKQFESAESPYPQTQEELLNLLHQRLAALGWE